MPDLVPTKAQLEVMKENIQGWKERLEQERLVYIAQGYTEEEAQRLIEPRTSFFLGIEEEIQEYEEFYKMEDNLKE